MAISSGAVGLVGTGHLLADAGWPTGIAERVADYPSAAMVIVLGVTILRYVRTRDEQPHPEQNGERVTSARTDKG